jgi:hypothetical protein
MPNPGNEIEVVNDPLSIFYNAKVEKTRQDPVISDVSRPMRS